MVCNQDVCDKVACANNKCKACNAKRRWMSPSAMTATQNHGQCRQVPHLPLETTADVAKCHTCQVKRSRMSLKSTQNEGGCHQVPRLPRETTADVLSAAPATQKCRGATGPKAPKRVTRPSQVSKVPRLPRKKTVDVTKCHACHVTRRRRSQSATPATQK